MSFFNNKPYDVWAKITRVGKKEIGNAVPVILAGNELNTDQEVSLEQLTGMIPTKIDEVTAGTIYFGFFKGQLDSEETTAIYKIVEADSVTEFYVPEGGLAFNKAWDNRATITYVLKTV